MTTFQPDTWLTSLQRSLKDFIEAKINAYFLDNNNLPTGANAFEIVFDWPQSDELAKSVKLPRAIIHLIVDDISNVKLGFGSDVVDVDEEIHLPASADLRFEKEAQGHVLNFDVGVWTSDQSGGSTTRLVAYEMLQKILNTQMGREELHDTTGGVEVIHFTGGRFITDTINDVRVFRIIDSELVVRVYSRMISQPQVIPDQDPDVNETLEIDNITIV